MLDYWLALRNLEGIGNFAGRRLVEHFGDPRAVFEAGRSAWATVEGVGPVTVQRLAQGPDLKAAQRERSRILDRGARIVPLTDPLYPEALRNLHDAPLVLTVCGTLEEHDRNAVAIVGSRNASAYGIKMATYLARELARAGLTVVSGLAHGIDSAAHRGALTAGGRTVAVLGCGIDQDYPPRNRETRKSITESGALITEFPLGMKPLKGNFPKRNRLISGLCLGVIIVEAGMQSGSLITARLALEQGREVFAVPGKADSPQSRGCHWLLKQGAKLVDSPGDVLEEIAPNLEQPRSGESPAPPLPSGLGDEERKVLMLCDEDAVHVDDLAAQSGIAVSRLASILLTLELQNLIEQLPGTRYRRKAES